VVDLLETAGLADRNSLSVAADISGGRSLLDNIGLSPNPFSPNGDGVNDEVAITYDVLRLINAGTISVQVYDLSGRSVRALRERQLTSGGYTEIWDGTDDAGDLVAPGVYMVRINADVDVGEKAIVHTVAVAY